jgi:prevent-host-death family protein
VRAEVRIEARIELQSRPDPRPASRTINGRCTLLRSATDATMARMKSRMITQRELRNQSAAILREVEAGRTIVVTRNGTPVGELRPIRRRRFVPRAAIADAAARAPRIDGDRFRADLDAVINPHIDD